MTAPTLQAEGAALSNNTTGNLAVVIPDWATDDIVIVSSGYWGPNSAAIIDIPTPGAVTGIGSWASMATQLGDADGRLAWFWARATAGGAAAPTSFTRPGTGNWDTGNDTCWHGRAYLIRGCVTTGDPWDAATTRATTAAANWTLPAVTVSGSERLVVQFVVRTDDYVTAGSVTGWTDGTPLETGTGTDGSEATHRKDNQSASTSADATTWEATAQGYASSLGVSFKPPEVTPEIPYLVMAPRRAP